MARSINKLSAIEVEKKSKPGRYGDGGGLWLHVSPSGAKSWVFRYMFPEQVPRNGLGESRYILIATSSRTRIAPAPDTRRPKGPPR